MNIIIFFLGIRFATFVASGIFFLKFWRASRDRFFLLFCIACWILAFEVLVTFVMIEIGYAVIFQVSERSSWVYLLRLSAFLTILVAVIEKNRSLNRSG